MYNRRTLAFVRAVELGSLAEAGRELRLSAVSVKKQVDALEAGVGARLLVRTHRGVEPTEAGRIVYEAARRVIAISDEASLRAREAAGRSGHVIRVGTSFLLPCDEVVRRWTALGDAGKYFRIEIVPFSDDDIGTDAILDELGRDIDLFCGPCDPGGWEGRASVSVLWECPVRVAVSHDDPLVGRGSLTWGDLEGRDLLLPLRYGSPMLDAHRAEARLHPGVRVHEWRGFYNASAFNECVARGWDMATIDPWANVHPSMVTLPMDWGYSIPFALVYALNPPRAVTEFVDLIAAT